MLLLSPKLLQIIKLSIKYANFFSVIPFRWNDRLDQLEYNTNSKLNGIISWNHMKYIILIQGIFTSVAFYKSIWEVSVNFNWLEQLVIDLAWLLAVSLSCFQQVTFMDKGRDLVITFNRFLKYYRELEGKVDHSYIHYKNRIYFLAISYLQRNFH